MGLRDYQLDLVERVRTEFAAGKRRVVMQLPTGGGKTWIFVHITKAAIAKGGRVMILVHRHELAKQASDDLYDLGVPHGWIMSGVQENPREAVQVGSIQTAANRPQWFGWPTLIIVDEAHHAVAKTWRRILEANPQARVIGPTATPCRLDGRGLGEFFDSLVLGPSVKELVARGFLARPRLFCPPVVANLKGLRSRGGDWQRNQLELRMKARHVVGDAVAHYRRILAPAPAIAFCSTVGTAEVTADTFRAAGFASASIDGKTKNRGRLLEDLAEGRLHVLTSCDVISEGTDVPVVTGGIMLRPTKSLSLWLQQCGRTMRPNTPSVILDHVGNTMVHGLPTEDREWTLGGVAASEPSIRTCGECWVVVEPGASVCHECGATLETRSTGESTREPIEEVEGELVEVDENEIKRRRRAEVAAARSRAELEAIAKERGYKARWVDHVLKARGGRWAG